MNLLKSGFEFSAGVIQPACRLTDSVLGLAQPTTDLVLIVSHTHARQEQLKGERHAA